MPDHDRNLSFMHTLSQDHGDGARCPSCRGTGVTLQADCVCCGREVVVSLLVPKAEDITSSIKSLSINTETVPDGRSSPQPVIIPSFVQESKPAIPGPARPRLSDERQTRTRSAPTLRSFNYSERAGVDAREGRYGSMGQLLQYGSRPSSSSRRGCANGTRGGSSGRGAGRGAHQTFKGVRTRKGVKGFLVEIRPPKWKKTIWLGTYNTSLEAAGAYDAGVFYTKKSNTKYNFQTSVGAFPPLPAHLRLDTADSMEEIKLFVQSQAREAARRMGNTLRTSQHPQQAQTSTVEHPVRDPVPATANQNSGQQPTSSGSCLTGTSDADVLETESNSASQLVVVEIDSDFQIPMDLDYLGQCLQDETAAKEAANDMFMDYTNYVTLQGGPDHQELLLPEEEDV